MRPSDHPAPGPRGIELACVELEWVVALEACDHAHLARPRDAWHDDRGELHVVVEPEGTVLATWLEERAGIEPGEAVTVLLPVLAAVAHLRHRGAEVSSLPVEGVLIDGHGTPVLARALLAPGSLGARATHVAAVASLVSAVLGCVRGEAGLVASPRAVAASSLDELVELVHDLAEPLPLATVSQAPAPSSTAPAAEEGVLAAPAWAALLPESAVVERVLAWWARGGPRTVPAALRTVRPRFWFVGTGVVGALVASLVLLGDPGAGVASDDSDDRPVASRARPSPIGEEAPHPTDAVVPTDPVPTDVVPTDPVAPTEAPLAPLDGQDDAASAALDADDPVAAASVLLAAREGCLRDLVGSCLREVDHEGSPLLAADLAYLAEPGATAPSEADCQELVERARWGGSALLACDGPGTATASVLVVRTEAGWRLRELVPEKDRVGP